MSTIRYKDYQASVEFSDDKLFIKVLHIDDLLIAQVDNASDAVKALQDLVEDYLADCVEEGREPNKPFKGSFNVRVSPDLHRRIAMTAADQGKSLNAWVNEAISEKVECNRWSERIDSVFEKRQTEVTLVRRLVALEAEVSSMGDHVRPLLWENDQQERSFDFRPMLTSHRGRTHA